MHIQPKINLKTGEIIESYLESRLRELGCPPEKNKVISPDYKGAFENSEKIGELTYDVFTSDVDDNIIINYFTLRGRPYPFRKEENKWANGYKRIRYKTPVINKDGSTQKYSSPKGSGVRPFFTPGIIVKFLAKETIPVLVITEGEFKAFKGDLSGIDIVGIPSIHGFSEEKKLHPDLEELIIQCQVEKLVFLTDADTLSIHFEPNKDLYKRPNSFYSAVSNFRESTTHLIGGKSKLKDVYFAHILSIHEEKGKGLDDLLCEFQARENEVKAELINPNTSNKFFHFINISDGNLQGIRRHFGLKDENEFYAQYGKYIGLKEFVFKNRVYQFDGSEVAYVKHKDVDDYMRVGDTWMTILKQPNKFGEYEESVKKYNISEIKRDYSKYPGFIDQIKKYKGFCNVPCNNGSYQRDYKGFFNLYNPLKHYPVLGDISNSIFFLKHLFGGEGNVKVYNNESGPYFIECAKLGDPFTVALDYLTLMFQKPQQILPVPCLVSPENNTGKSTFLKWLQDIYGSNATILGNEQFKMNFNGHYITKFIIGIDEGFIEVEKKADKERIKKLATDEKQFLEMKGVDIHEIDYFGKIIICSNDADNLMRIEEGEIRWFVIRVPKFSKEDPLFRDKLKSEIPAWLDFIKNRTVFHPQEGRAWFKPEYLVTEQLKKVISTTKTRIEKEVNEFITDMFLKYRQAVIKMHLDFIVDSINRQAKYKIDKTELKKYLKDKKGIAPGGTQRFKIPIGINFSNPDGRAKSTISTEEFIQRPYIFRVEEWLTEDEFREFNSIVDCLDVQIDEVNELVAF